MKYICPDCGKQYETGKFCLECGAKLQEIAPELVCPSCGFKAKSGKFCPECGTKLEEQYGASAVAAKSDTPERKFNERDPRFAKYYDKKGFPRTLPQEERAVAIEELSPFAEQNIAEAKMLLGLILISDSDSFLEGAKLLKEAAEVGDKLAYYGMAFCYLVGVVVNQDIDEAEKRLLELNKEYDGEANDTLAELYAFYKIDYKRAFQYATVAAEEDEQGGYKILGDLYLHGWGVTKNVQKAFDNYKMAAAFGDAVAMNQIGWLYQGNEEGFEADPEQAFYWYNESAKKGDDVGMFNVGWCYQNGFGVKKDDEIAAEWFKKSAELGYVNAMNELGDYYQNVLIDLDKAESWYRKGADLGDAECQNKLGVLLDKNLDCEEANSWYQKAMEQNHPNAYDNYATNLWEGNGVEENKQKAIELKKKAVELGLVDEINRLGVWYGQIGNDEKANECFLKAIDQEDPWGYYNYGSNLWNGYGVEENKDKAIEFLSKAAEMGLEEAQADLDKMQNDKDNESKKDIYFEKNYIDANNGKFGGSLSIDLFLRNVEHYEPFKTFIESGREDFEPLGYKIKYSVHGNLMSLEDEEIFHCWNDGFGEPAVISTYLQLYNKLPTEKMVAEVKYPVDINIGLYENDDLICKYSDSITIVKHSKIFGKNTLEIVD